jgi:hypothetical protein
MGHVFRHVNCHGSVEVDTPINGLGKLAVLVGLGGALDHTPVMGVSSLAEYVTVVPRSLSAGLALRGLGEVFEEAPWRGVSVTSGVAAYRDDPAVKHR